MIGLTALVTSPLSAAQLRCPPRLPGPHVGFEQVGPVPSAHWLLWRMRLFNASPAGAPNTRELAPHSTIEQRNGFTSTWHFLGNENLSMVCLYNGSATFYRALLRPLPSGCTARNDDGLTRAWCETP